MIDVTSYRLNFRGYPVTLVSDGVAALLAESGHGSAWLSWVLREAADTAEPGEPYGWLFSSDIDGHVVQVERFGGVRDDTGHHDGQWSVYLPGER
jgi:hypothetical protein